MLFLTRKVFESIIIKNEIKVIVLSAEDNNVRLGIKVPKD
jgi:carbon storage regulator CsrA